MLNVNGSVVQIEIGDAILGEVLQNNHDTTELLDTIETMVLAPVRQKGIPIPLTTIWSPTSNPNDTNIANSDEVWLYFGLEQYSRRINFPLEMYQWLQHILEIRWKEYDQIASDASSIRTYLGNAYTLINQDRYQDAFEFLKIAYYHSISNNYDVEAAYSVSAAGNILVYNREYFRGGVFHVKATKLSQSPNIVDASLKAQFHYNLGVVASALGYSKKLAEEYRFALENYNIALQFASHADHHPLILASLIGSADIHTLLGNYDLALKFLSGCEDLIVADDKITPEELPVLAHVRGSIIEIYKQLWQQYQNTGNEAQIANDSVSTTAISFYDTIKDGYARINELILPLLTHVLSGAVLKLLRLPVGARLVLFGSTKYDARGSVFKGPTQMGRQNIQNLVMDS